MWDENKEPYVYTKHHNHFFFYPDVLDRDWWFILGHDTRSKHLFENTMLSCQARNIIYIMTRNSDMYMISNMIGASTNSSI